MRIGSALAGSAITLAVVVGGVVAVSAANGAAPEPTPTVTRTDPGYVLVPKEIPTMPPVSPRPVATVEPTQEPTVTETTAPAPKPKPEPAPVKPTDDPRKNPPKTIGTPPPGPPNPVMPSP